MRCLVASVCFASDWLKAQGSGLTIKAQGSGLHHAATSGLEGCRALGGVVGHAAIPLWQFDNRRARAVVDLEYCHYDSMSFFKTQMEAVCNSKKVTIKNLGGALTENTAVSKAKMRALSWELSNYLECSAFAVFNFKTCLNIPDALTAKELFFKDGVYEVKNLDPFNKMPFDEEDCWELIMQSGPYVFHCVTSRMQKLLILAASLFRYHNSKRFHVSLLMSKLHINFCLHFGKCGSSLSKAKVLAAQIDAWSLDPGAFISSCTYRVRIHILCCSEKHRTPCGDRRAAHGRVARFATLGAKRCWPN